MDQFLQALQSVDMSNPGNHVAGIQALFTKINSLDAPGIMAAFQTYKFFFDEFGEIDTATSNRLDKVSDAMITRMLTLCAQAPVNERRGLAHAFLESTGEYTSYFFKFKNAGFVSRDDVR